MKNREFRDDLKEMWLRKHAENTRDPLLTAGSLPVLNSKHSTFRDVKIDKVDAVIGFPCWVPKRRTLAQSVGRLMAWMFGVPALCLAALAVGEYFGWWV